MNTVQSEALISQGYCKLEAGLAKIPRQCEENDTTQETETLTAPPGFASLQSFNLVQFVLLTDTQLV